MKEPDQGEPPVSSLFPLDQDIINRLRDSMITGTVDPELTEKNFKPGHEVDNMLVLNTAMAHGISFRSADLSDIFTMSSIFTYAVIGHTARRRGLDVPAVIDDDIDASDEVLLRFVPKPSTSLLSGEVRTKVTQRYTDILSKPEEQLAHALSAIVNARLPGPTSHKLLALFGNTAHYGAGVIYFPFVEAQKRLATANN